MGHGASPKLKLESPHKGDGVCHDPLPLLNFNLDRPLSRRRPYPLQITLHGTNFNFDHHSAVPPRSTVGVDRTSPPVIPLLLLLCCTLRGTAQGATSRCLLFNHTIGRAVATTLLLAPVA